MVRPLHLTRASSPDSLPPASGAATRRVFAGAGAARRRPRRHRRTGSAGSTRPTAMRRPWPTTLQAFAARRPRRRPDRRLSCSAWAAAACAPRCCATCPARRANAVRARRCSTRPTSAPIRAVTEALVNPSTSLLHRRQQERVDDRGDGARAALLARDVDARSEPATGPALRRDHRSRHGARGARRRARLSATRSSIRRTSAAATRRCRCSGSCRRRCSGSTSRRSAAARSAWRSRAAATRRPIPAWRSARSWREHAPRGRDKLTLLLPDRSRAARRLDRTARRREHRQGRPRRAADRRRAARRRRRVRTGSRVRGRSTPDDGECRRDAGARLERRRPSGVPHRDVAPRARRRVLPLGVRDGGRRRGARRQSVRRAQRARGQDAHAGAARRARRDRARSGSIRRSTRGDGYSRREHRPARAARAAARRRYRRDARLPAGRPAPRSTLVERLRAAIRAAARASRPTHGVGPALSALDRPVPQGRTEHRHLRAAHGGRRERDAGAGDRVHVQHAQAGAGARRFRRARRATAATSSTTTSTIRRPTSPPTLRTRAGALAELMIATHATPARWCLALRCAPRARALARPAARDARAPVSARTSRHCSKAPDRDEWQQPERIMDALRIADGVARRRPRRRRRLVHDPSRAPRRAERRRLRRGHPAAR